MDRWSPGASCIDRSEGLIALVKMLCVFYEMYLDVSTISLVMISLRMSQAIDNKNLYSCDLR